MWTEKKWNLTKKETIKLNWNTCKWCERFFFAQFSFYIRTYFMKTRWNTCTRKVFGDGYKKCSIEVSTMKILTTNVTTKSFPVDSTESVTKISYERANKNFIEHRNIGEEKHYCAQILTPANEMASLNLPINSQNQFLDCHLHVQA